MDAALSFAEKCAKAGNLEIKLPAAVAAGVQVPVADSQNVSFATFCAYPVWTKAVHVAMTRLGKKGGSESVDIPSNKATVTINVYITPSSITLY